MISRDPCGPARTPARGPAAACGCWPPPSASPRNDKTNHAGRGSSSYRRGGRSHARCMAPRRERSGMHVPARSPDGTLMDERPGLSPGHRVGAARGTRLFGCVRQALVPLSMPPSPEPSSRPLQGDLTGCPAQHPRHRKCRGLPEVSVRPACRRLRARCGQGLRARLSSLFAPQLRSDPFSIGFKQLLRRICKQPRKK